MEKSSYCERKEKQILRNPEDAPVSAQEHSGFQVKTHYELVLYGNSLQLLIFH